MSKFLQAVLDTGEGQGLAGVVGGLDEGEAPGEVEGLVHIHGGDDLPGHRVPPGVAGHHHGKDRLVIEPGLSEQGGEAVDKGGEVGGQGVVVVGAQQHQSVRRPDGGVDLVLKWRHMV